MDFSIQFDTYLAPGTPLVAGFGVFDGVHPGHRLIVRKVVEMAERCGALPAAVTFVPHPRAVIPGGTAPEAIISVPERIAQLRLAGARAVGIIDFTPEFGAMAPEAFLEALLHFKEFKLAGICVGEDWRFGKMGKGDACMLSRFARDNGFGFQAVERLTCGGCNISSSVIRELAAKGDLEGAAKILGRPLTLSGTVVQGFRIAGSQLNAPTANLRLDHGLLVPDGVYAGAAVTEKGPFAAVLNIGMAPTYDVNERRIEVHLLNFEGSLYDKPLTVKLFKYLRPERKFPSPAELREQIGKDIAQADFIYHSITQEV